MVSSYIYGFECSNQKNPKENKGFLKKLMWKSYLNHLTDNSLNLTKMDNTYNSNSQLKLKQDSESTEIARVSSHSKIILGSFFPSLLYLMIYSGLVSVNEY